MAELLGIEIRGDQVLLTVVNRRAEPCAHLSEPLAETAGAWWLFHPDELLRGVRVALRRGVEEGVFRGEQIAGVGLVVEPGLVLLDPDLQAIPPRALPWQDVLEEGFSAPPVAALRLLLENDPRLAGHVGAVLSTLDYLRFQMTGALATHLDFAWRSGLVIGPLAPESWDPGAIRDLGLAPGVFPPIFRAPSRVGALSEEMVRLSGMRRGTWVNAGSDPLSVRLLMAAEPRPGTRVALIEESGDELWQAGPAPEAWSAEARPGILEEIWFHRTARRLNEPSGEFSTLLEGEGAVILDFRTPPDSSRWPLELPGDVRVAGDAGQPSTGTALQAGIGLGWWRDRRTLWRKRRPPVGYSRWRSRLGESPGPRPAGVAPAPS
ncbi:MAG: FGGY family carbohydrate kinase [Planctomycetota bacterium]